MKPLRDIRENLAERARLALRRSIRDAYVWSCTKAIVMGPYGMRRVWDYYPQPVWAVRTGRWAGIIFAVSAPFTMLLPKLGVLPEPPPLIGLLTGMASNVFLGLAVLGPKRVPGSVRFEGDPAPGYVCSAYAERPVGD